MSKVSDKKKICMVGDFAVGKTSLTQRFVNNVFSEKYLTTVGVKIDTIEVDETKLVIWDVAGRDSLSPINVSYLVGASGYLLVTDGTRADTINQAETLKKTVEDRIGSVPFVLVVNKYDDQDNWAANEDVLKQFENKGWQVILTSAKDNHNVEQAFMLLKDEMKKQTNK